MELLISPVRVLNGPAEQDLLSPEVPPVPQADLPAIMLKLVGSPHLGGELLGFNPLLLDQPLLHLLQGCDLPLSWLP